MPRLFVGVRLPEAARAALEGLFRDRPPLRGARLVGGGELHATLRFIGPLAPDKIAAVVRALTSVEAAAFELGLAGLGTFPPGAAGTKRKVARVLWAGLSPEEPLATLKQAVDAALLPIIGADAEAARGFHPHITLARWKDGAAADLPDFLAAHRAFTYPAWQVTAFELMQSLLHPSGAQYATERRYPLRVGPTPA